MHISSLPYNLSRNFTHTPMLDQSYQNAELITSIAKRNTQAFEEFYEHYAPITYALILRIVHERTLADEILQETFLQVWGKASEYHSDISPAAWVYRIARMRSLEALRWSLREPIQQTAHLQAVYQEARSHATALQSVIACQTEPTLYENRPAIRVIASDPVQQVLGNMSEEQRVCLELAFFGGLTQQQIADFLHSPKDRVRGMIRTGLETLKSVLSMPIQQKGGVPA